MEYKDFIKAGNKVIYVPTNNSLLTEYEKCKLMWTDPIVVEISEYRPYFTDGTPDPTPDEYEDCCQVEVIGDVDDSQIRLECLLPIIKVDEPTNVIYKDDVCPLIGYDEDDYYAVVEYDGEWKVCWAEDAPLVRDLYSLTRDDLKVLRDEICCGSLYIADYRNSFAVDPHYLCVECESYIDALEERFCKNNNKDWTDYDTPERFAEFIYDGKFN